MARRLAHPDYAEQVHDQEAFAREVLTLHKRVTSSADSAGRFQMPWLRAIGTPPWAVARELQLVTGTDYSVHPVRPGGKVWRHLQRATPDRPAAVYIGNRLCPRHVVLVARVADGSAWTYEPASGVMTLVARTRWTGADSAWPAGTGPGWWSAPDAQPMSSA